MVVINSDFGNYLTEKNYNYAKKLFKEYGIRFVGNAICHNRYTAIHGFIENSKIEVRISVMKEKFRIIFNIACDNGQNFKIKSFKSFNKKFKNGVLNYFEEQIKLKEIETDFE